MCHRYADDSDDRRSKRSTTMPCNFKHLASIRSTTFTFIIFDCSEYHAESHYVPYSACGDSLDEASANCQPRFGDNCDSTDERRASRLDQQTVRRFSLSVGKCE